MTPNILNHNIATYEALLKLYYISYKILTHFHLVNSISRIILGEKDEVVP